MKSEIRKQNKVKRSAMRIEEVMQKSHVAANIFLASDYYKNSKQLMLYMPLGNETDTSAIIKTAFCDGKTVVFPVTDEKSGEITPFYASEDTKFLKGTFSVLEPVGTQIADMSKTDVILVPGIAFDKTGNRVGFGKGCYDRLLKDSSAALIGFCYEFQICEHIPSEPHDIKMDALVTEKGLFRCKNTRLPADSSR